MADSIRDNNQSSGVKVSVEGSRARRTPNGREIFTGTLERTANVAMTAANTVAPYVPGMAVVSAAITGVGALKDASGAGATSAATAGNATQLSFGGASGGVAAGGQASSGVFADVERQAAAGDSGAQQLLATREMQSMNQSMNVQYLMLQQEMQAENRQFSVMSNIMKLRHETSKGTIQNFR